MCPDSETLGTYLVYGLIMVGILNNIVIMGLYAYGVVLLRRKLKGTHPTVYRALTEAAAYVGAPDALSGREQVRVATVIENALKRMRGAL